MTFSELTWNPDQWNEELEAHMGWQAQYVAPNDCLLVVNTQLNADLSAPQSATENGQMYSCAVYSWDREEDSEPLSIESDCGDDRVQTIISEVEALQGETTTTTTAAPTTTTTTAAPAPAPQWD
jgi:hypothetical protein